MKRIWCVLCVSLIAFAPMQMALGDGEPAASSPTSAGVASAAKNLKEAWPTTPAPAHQTRVKGAPNFGKLNAQIWRSGQPTREGYQSLAKMGLKTVVNLREEFPQDKDLLPEGVRYVYIPIKDQHAPTDAQAKQFIEVASNPENWPLLVHCHAGEGRAGVMSALVRHSLDGWDHDRIMEEVGNFRRNFSTASMPSCQRTFIRNWEDTANLALK